MRGHPVSKWESWVLSPVRSDFPLCGAVRGCWSEGSEIQTHSKVTFLSTRTFPLTQTLPTRSRQFPSWLLGALRKNIEFFAPKSPWRFRKCTFELCSHYLKKKKVRGQWGVG